MSASMSRSSGRLRSPGEGPREARPTTLGDHDMTLPRMDNVLIVVEDLEAAKAFFAELGMELEGETQVEGPSVDSTVGLEGVRADITMMRAPDGHGRVELTRFHTPAARRGGAGGRPGNPGGPPQNHFHGRGNRRCRPPPARPRCRAGGRDG